MILSVSSEKKPTLSGGSDDLVSPFLSINNQNLLSFVDSGLSKLSCGNFKEHCALFALFFNELAVCSSDIMDCKKKNFSEKE